MKKFLILLICLSSYPAANAQFIYHDLTASYGFATSYQIMDVIEDVLVATFSFGTYEKEDYNYSGALFVSYKYAPSYRINTGVALGIDRVSGDLIQNDVKYGDFTESHTTLALEADYRWVKQEVIQFYTMLGLGYTLNTETGSYNTTGQTDTETSSNVAFQVTPIGMRIGRKLGGFAELGFGYKGIMNFGLSYRF